MKINDYKIGTIFFITCTKEVNKRTNKIYYNNFEINPSLASIWGRKREDVILVKATIIEEDVLIQPLFRDQSYDVNSIDYFGHIDFKKDGTYNICMIYPNIHQYFICFPYGPDSERFYNCDFLSNNIHKGDRKSMTVRLKIEEF